MEPHRIPWRRIERLTRHRLRRRPGRGWQGEGPFGRFTETARRAIVLSQEEARRLHHNHVGTEHVLLGLLAIEDTAAHALHNVGVRLWDAQREVERIIGRGAAAAATPVAFTPRAKKVLELSLSEALKSGRNMVTDIDLLLGLVREGEGVAAQVLASLAGGLDRVVEAAKRAPTVAEPGRWGHVANEVHELVDENERLRGLLRLHGVDPDPARPPEEDEPPSPS